MTAAGAARSYLRTSAADSAEIHALRLTRQSVHDYWISTSSLSSGIRGAFGGASFDRLPDATTLVDGDAALFSTPVSPDGGAVCVLVLGRDTATGALIGLTEQQVAILVQRITAEPADGSGNDDSAALAGRCRRIRAQPDEALGAVFLQLGHVGARAQKV